MCVRVCMRYMRYMCVRRVCEVYVCVREMFVCQVHVKHVWVMSDMQVCL